MMRQYCASEPTFCRACGASIPHRIGEGRCPECIQHLPTKGADHKGKHNGECNRTACRANGLQVCMWSFTEHAYYCVACSKEIERWSGPVGVKPMECRDSPSITPAEPSPPPKGADHE